jgi:hypothetical protein
MGRSRTEQLQQTVKHTPKKVFWVYFNPAGPGSLVSVEGMMNSEKYRMLRSAELFQLGRRTSLKVMEFSSIILRLVIHQEK